MEKDSTAAPADRAPRKTTAARRILRAAGWLLVALVVLAAAGALWLRSRLLGSLPATSGEAPIVGLTAAVEIQRDALGVPTVTATNRLDAATALGFLHGQERFFQMDLLRRLAAGELSEIVGRAALPTDRDQRLHRGRALAEESLRRASPDERALVEAYTRGVNAGLAALAAPPPEYLVLRATPVPWRPADSYLAVIAMFFRLSDPHARMQALMGDLQASLPRQLVDFIEPIGTEWDAPLFGNPYPTPPIPGPDVVDLQDPHRPGTPQTGSTAAAADTARSAPAAPASPDVPAAAPMPATTAVSATAAMSTTAVVPAPASAGALPRAVDRRAAERAAAADSTAAAADSFAAAEALARTVLATLAPATTARGAAGAGALAAIGAAADDDRFAAGGSNNWAVSGAHTADGHALLANDMHLALGLPNTWYRAALRWRGAGGAAAGVTGVTLPGTPGVAVGSNGHVAWGFTNSYGDFADLIDLEIDPHDADVYRTPDGPRHFVHRHERIAVHGGRDEDLDVAETIWGPVVDRTAGRPPRALQWTAHHPEAVNLGVSGLESATTVAAAIAAAHLAGIPPQNFTVVDDQGHIGWTLIGQIPRRVGFDGRTPTSWADGRHTWNGWLSPAEVPVLIDPPAGRIWTANARTLDGEALARFGDGGYDLGARARQIRDDLLRLEAATPRDLLAVQLDDRALYLDRWRGVLLAVLTPDTLRAHPRRAALRRAADAGWTGRASVDSTGYRAVRAFHFHLWQQVFTSLSRLPAGETATRAAQLSKQFEGPLWRLVTERPRHLLDPQFHSWDEALLAAADQTAAEAGPDPAARTWGERNTVQLRHPLSRGLPILSRWLDTPAHPLPGDNDMPRVQTPAAGASERIVVSPGREAAGIFEMPGGESGHPLAPHYRDLEPAWEHGNPTPFLPGPAVTTLRLVPPGR